MTDRLRGVLVTFEKDIREDDAEEILNAIRMVKGVLTVKPLLVNNLEQAIAEDRVRHELHQKLFKVIYPDTKLTE